MVGVEFESFDGGSDGIPAYLGFLDDRVDVFPVDLIGHGAPHDHNRPVHLYRGQGQRAKVSNCDRSLRFVRRKERTLKTNF